MEKSGFIKLREKLCSLIYSLSDNVDHEPQ